MNPDELNRAKIKIGRNYLRLIMEKTGLSRSTVSAVMKGKWENDKVMKAVTEILTEKEERTQKFKQLLA